MKYISSSSYLGRGGRPGWPLLLELEETEEYCSRRWYGSRDECADAFVG